MTDKNNLVIWALTDDRPGNKNQCLGVAEALAMEFQVRELLYTAAAALPNFVIGASFDGLNAKSRDNLQPPWPDLVIAAGRRTAPIARNIKARNNNKTFLVQIMYPGDSGAREFDLIAAPGHDELSQQGNIMTITGAPHRINKKTLKKADKKWRQHFENLPAPRIALIVGGSTKRRQFTPAMALELGKRASSIAHNAGGSLLISTSRRSGQMADVLINEITCPSHIYRWNDAGENPYMGYLAVADAIIVTGDSVSMCSEACAAGSPVYIYAPAKLITAKHARLHKDLFAKGHARPLDKNIEKWSAHPLDPADAIAAQIKKRMGL